MKVTTENRVAFVAAFVDEDDRTISINNPRTGLTKADFDNISAKAVNVLIGDKYAAKFSRIKSARYITGTITNYEAGELNA